MFLIIFSGLFIATVCGLAANGDLPFAVPALYVASSSTAFLMYWLDKSAAESGSRRTSEDVLLAVGLLGGWPGAVAAQKLLRHKSRKLSFQAMFWATVVVNCASLGWFWWMNR